jgi:uncharacterized protein
VARPVPALARISHRFSAATNPGEKPGLVLFARAPRHGEVKRRLTPPLTPDEALAVHLALLEDSLGLIGIAAREAEAQPFLSFSEPFEPTGSPALVFLETAARGIPRLPQRPGDLGARILGAFTDLIDGQRRPGAVIVGSDSPTLPPAILVDALDRLRSGAEVVLGPAEDGGYYLIGATRPMDALFDGIPWGTSDVLAATLRAIDRERLRVALLETWHDVDRPEDLPRLRREIAERGPGLARRTGAALEHLARQGRLPPG